MVFGFSSSSIALSRQDKLRSYHAKQFADESVEALEERLVYLHETAEVLRGSHDIALAEYQHPHFIKLGVFDALSKMKGVEYACNVINISLPKKSLLERMNSYLKNN